MGLEAATFLSGLVPTNPVATDKKNQGDDHFRLMKQVLQNTFPGADHAAPFPVVVPTSGNLTLTEANNNALVFVNTGGGAVNITLPSDVTYIGWSCRIVKVSSDSNPIFIVPPSGTLNGFAKIRANTYLEAYEFFSTGANTYLHLKPAGQDPAGTPIWSANINPPTGYGTAAGNSLLRLDFPELFAAWGTTYGAVDGTHFTTPQLLGKFIVGAGGSYPLAATGGADTVTLTINEIPSHQVTGATDNGGIDHTHTETTPQSTTGQFSGLISPNNGWGGTPPNNSGNTGTASAYLHAHSFTANPIGGGAAHENRPPYLALYPFFRLC